MATKPSSDPNEDLQKQMKLDEVAIAELKYLPPGRAVYQKTGNLFFLTPVQKATASVQNQLRIKKLTLGVVDDVK